MTVGRGRVQLDVDAARPNRGDTEDIVAVVLGRLLIGRAQRASGPPKFPAQPAIDSWVSRPTGSSTANAAATAPATSPCTAASRPVATARSCRQRLGPGSGVLGVPPRHRHERPSRWSFGSGTCLRVSLEGRLAVLPSLGASSCNQAEGDASEAPGERRRACRVRRKGSDCLTGRNRRAALVVEKPS